MHTNVFYMIDMHTHITISFPDVPASFPTPIVSYAMISVTPWLSKLVKSVSNKSLSDFCSRAAVIAANLFARVTSQIALSEEFEF